MTVDGVSCLLHDLKAGINFLHLIKETASNVAPICACSDRNNARYLQIGKALVIPISVQQTTDQSL